MKTVAIATLGCKVNQYDSEELSASLEEKGYRIIPFEEGADITIINTCTVTHRADFESRQLVRKAIRHNPNSLIILTGCYVQTQPERLESLHEVKYLFGNNEKSLIPELLPSMILGETPKIQVSKIPKKALSLKKFVPSFSSHTRAFLKIQDGCEARCSYCIVPFARGPSRSLPLDRVIDHLRWLKAKGFKEVVLTGIHIGSYGKDLLSYLSLEKLLQEIDHHETPPRIRLSSIEPQEFSPHLLYLLSQSQKVCPHVHIPIQSGAEGILKKMKRDYDPLFIRDLIERIHQEMPQASIGADIIVGFPGEGEKEFEQTYRLLDSLPLSYLHVFPYSVRKGTEAATFEGKVSEKEIKRRAEFMRRLGREKRRSFFSKFLHQDLEVLIEDRKERGTGRRMGLSRNYIPVVLLDEGPFEVNQEIKVKVIDFNEKVVFGKVVYGN
ncbi:MAG: tRNA (N(6)-L-threonylcarbamoyladenosine(37)-C(2))-methylthiotransferase MtaB [Thermodesulfobacteriota bacterium]